MSKQQPPANVTEADFLAQQARKAKDAISQTLHEMADSLKNMGDPRTWIEQYPWSSLGAGAIAGFVLGSALTPTREQTLSERLKSLFPEKAPRENITYIAAEPPRQQKSGFLGSVMDAVKTAIAASVSSAITAKAGGGSDQGDNGQHAAAQQAATT